MTATAAYERFAANRNGDSGSLPALVAPRRDRAVAPSEDAALGRLGDALRAVAYDNAGDEALSRFALGFSVALAALPGGLGDALVAAGVAEEGDDGVRLRFAVLAVDGAYAAIPTEDPHTDLVYVGADSVLLLDHASAVARGGERAADLGTGTGVVAACMAATYVHVVATDLLLRATAVARQTVSLNRFPDGHRVDLVVADVTAGLTPRRFDLVVANAPWVPTGVTPRVFADGGPTGFELPRRFITGAAELLAPGGVSVTLGIDVTWGDGRRPMVELCARLEADGFRTEITPTALPDHVSHLRPKLLERLPGATHAEHVAVVVRRA